MAKDKSLQPVPATRRSEIAEARRKRDDANRAEILSLLMAGLSYDQIAERKQMSHSNVVAIVARALSSEPESGIETLRAVENARLDRAQFAIWTRVLQGDDRAIGTFLRISAQRARLNGLDAPLRIEMNAHIRIEMEQALQELQQIVLGEVIPDDYPEADWGNGDTA